MKSHHDKHSNDRFTEITQGKPINWAFDAYAVVWSDYIKSNVVVTN